MRDPSIPWPKLIGSAMGLSTAGLIFWEVREWWGRSMLLCHGYTGSGNMVFTEWLSLILLPEWVALIATIVLLLLSHFLYRGRNWARRTVITIGICLASLVFVSAAITAAQTESFLYHESPKTLEIRIGQVCGFLGQLGRELLFLAPYAFFIGVLCHRDVAAAFHGKRAERANPGDAADYGSTRSR
jgi:hypothetical protein